MVSRKIRALNRKRRRIRRARAKVGENPALISRVKKYCFKLERPINLAVAHTSGLPTTNLTDAGVKIASIRINDCYRPLTTMGGVLINPDGWSQVGYDYSSWTTIYGKVTFAFDMRNCAGYKLYTLVTDSPSVYADLNIVPNFASAVASELTRMELLTALDRKVSKGLVNRHFLQRGDGYDSTGIISQVYNPSKQFQNVTNPTDDSNSAFHVKVSTTGVVTQPTALHYIHIILIPDSTDYTAAFMGTDTAMVWGRMYLKQICIAKNNDDQIAVNRVVETMSEYPGTSLLS